MLKFQLFMALIAIVVFGDAHTDDAYAEAFYGRFKGLVKHDVSSEEPCSGSALSTAEVTEAPGYDDCEEETEAPVYEEESIDEVTGAPVYDDCEEGTEAPVPQSTVPASIPYPMDGCIDVSVEGDATYCIEGPICSGHGDEATRDACPAKGDVAVRDCHQQLNSWVDYEDECVVPENAECQRVQSGAWGCVFAYAVDKQAENSTGDDYEQDVKRTEAAVTPAGAGVGAGVLVGIIVAAAVGLAVAGVLVARSMKKRRAFSNAAILANEMNATTPAYHEECATPV